MNQDSNYGVLKCNIIETRQASGKSPHFHIHTIAEGVHFRISINIKSQMQPLEVLYYLNENFTHEINARLTELPFGFNPIGPNIKRDFGLDYLRGNLFNIDEFRPLPDQYPGPDNDLNEKIRIITHNALQNQKSVLYAFGKRWGPEGKTDEYFRFTPGDGIHDVHMNQGNIGFFEKENSTWQDGGLIVNYLPENRWSAMFFAFQTQSFGI